MFKPNLFLLLIFYFLSVLFDDRSTSMNVSRSQLPSRVVSLTSETFTLTISKLGRESPSLLSPVYILCVFVFNTKTKIHGHCELNCFVFLCFSFQIKINFFRGRRGREKTKKYTHKKHPSVRRSI